MPIFQPQFGWFFTDLKWELAALLGITDRVFNAWYLWSVLAVFVFWLWCVVFNEIAEFRLSRIGRGLCPSCGYPVTDLPSAKCPECGAAFAEI